MGAHLSTQYPCRHCGTNFEVREYDYRTGRKKYCGTECYIATRPRGHKGFKSDYQRKRESIARHPEKHRCRMAFRRDWRAGRITAKPCFICGRKKVEAHHYDYAKPVDVFWLCRQHHVDVHKKRLTLPLPEEIAFPAV